MSSSQFNSTTNAWQHAPWQVRCVRNLGTNLRSVTKGEKVTAAYNVKVDNTTKGGVIKPIRYFGGALRNPTTLPLPLHKTSSPYNRLARYGFEIAPAGNGNTENYTIDAGMYAITYDETGTNPQSLTPIASTYSAIVAAIEKASPCEKLNKSSGRKGWRIPNQKEIVIMMRAGVITGQYSSYSLNGGVLSQTGKSWGSSGAGVMCCTQEHWPSMTGSNFGETSKAPINGSDPLSGRNRWCTIEPNSSLASAKKHSQIVGIRCVRDLTAAEANMTYTRIKKHKTN